MMDFTFDLDSIYPDEECEACAYFLYIPETHRGVMDGDPEEWDCKCRNVRLHCPKYAAEYERQLDKWLETQDA